MFLAAVMAAQSVVAAMPAYAAEETYGDFTYDIYGGDVIITGYTGDDQYVIIPDQIEDKDVTIIGSRAFSGNSSMEYVNLPNRLRSIASFAFSNCENLRCIVLPNSVECVGGIPYSSGYYDKDIYHDQYCFAENPSLEEFVMGSNVTEFGRAVLYRCTGLSEISFSEGLSFVSATGCFSNLSISNDYARDYSDAYIRPGNTNDVAWNDSITVHFPSEEMAEKVSKRGDGADQYDVIPFEDSHAKVTFDTNGGDTADSALWTLRGQSVSEEIPPEKEDCEFVGWYSNPEGKGEPWDFVMDKVSDDMTLYAKWRPIQYTVTFDADGGSCSVEKQDYSFGLKMEELPVPTRTNYQFIGWYTRADGNGELYTESTIMPRSDLKLYAAWLQNGKGLVVDFDANGGTCDTEKLIVDYNKPISDLPSVKRKGYTFVEWNSKADGTGDTYTKSTKVIHNNLTLYAIWKVKGCTVTLDANKGTVSKDSVVVNYDKKLGKLPEPVRDGYEFMGWFYENGDKAKSSDKVTADVTLTARWRGFEYMILFNAGKGKLTGKDTMSVYCGDLIGEMPVPTRKGYIFKGWYTKKSSKGTKYTAESEMPDKDLNLYAGWKKITEYASSVKLDKSKVTLGVGQTYALKITTTPEYTLDKFKWTSSNTKVATVNENGVITAKAKGKATIKVTTSKGKTATIKVTVKKAVSKITPSYTSRTIKIGQTVVASAKAKGYAGELTWTSSAPSVAKVDNDGNITAVKAGTATITIRAYNGVSATIKITVKK